MKFVIVVCVAVTTAIVQAKPPCGTPKDLKEQYILSSKACEVENGLEGEQFAKDLCEGNLKENEANTKHLICYLKAGKTLTDTGIDKEALRKGQENMLEPNADEIAEKCSPQGEDHNALVWIWYNCYVQLKTCCPFE